MPFEEVPKRANIDKITFATGRLTIPINVRREHFNETKRVRLYRDTEANLMAIKPDTDGFTVSPKGVIYTKKFDHITPRRYSGEWRDDMFIVDLNV